MDHTELGEGWMWPTGYGSLGHVKVETKSKTEGTQETSTRYPQGSRERRQGDYVTTHRNGTKCVEEGVAEMGPGDRGVSSAGDSTDRTGKTRDR